MKTTPAEATRRALVTRLESVKAAVRQTTSRASRQKDMVLVVNFAVECEGRRATGRMVDSQQRFVVDSKGLRIPIIGSKKDWVHWQAPGEPVHKAVLTAIYGTSNVKNDPKSNTSLHINWTAELIRRAITQRVIRHLGTKKVAEKVGKAEKVVRKKQMTEAMGRLLKEYPEMRRQDCLLAFEEAKRAQTVREVMET